MEGFCLHYQSRLYLFSHLRLCDKQIVAITLWVREGNFFPTVWIKKQRQKRGGGGAHKQKWVWPLWEMWWTSRSGGGGGGLRGGLCGWKKFGFADGNRVWNRHTLVHKHIHTHTHAEDRHQHPSFKRHFKGHLSHSNKNCSRYNTLSRGDRGKVMAWAG